MSSSAADFGLRNRSQYSRGGLFRHKHRPFLFRTPTHNVGLNLELLCLARLRRHQSIEFRVPRELVDKWHKGAAYLNKSIPCVHIRDIGELQVRNIEKLGKLHPVGAGLIQLNNKFTVRQHGTGRMAL